jgi:hypothetical protein
MTPLLSLRITPKAAAKIPQGVTALQGIKTQSTCDEADDISAIML